MKKKIEDATMAELIVKLEEDPDWIYRQSDITVIILKELVRRTKTAIEIRDEWIDFAAKVLARVKDIT